MLSMNEPSSYCYNKNVKIDFVKPEIVLIFAASFCQKDLGGHRLSSQWPLHGFLNSRRLLQRLLGLLQWVMGAESLFGLAFI